MANIPHNPISRRSLITGSLFGLSLGTLSAVGLKPQIQGLVASQFESRGSIVGGPAALGHLPRTYQEPSIARVEKVGIVILGGGISGLAAGWQLDRLGFSDYSLLELHSQVGGNALGGSLSHLAHPWGAHYLPVPNKESVYVRELLQEMGVASTPEHPGPRDFTPPAYDETALIAEQSERLFLHGRWQSGVTPHYGVSPSEMEQHVRFRDLMSEFRERRGTDGRPAFAIPIELSSSDHAFTKFDSYSFAQFIAEHGFSAPTLLWYLEYCCKDDFGALPNEISAWAGIHYFASRRGWSTNADSFDLLTWPEGNFRLAQALAARSHSRIRTGAVVLKITPGSPHRISYLDLKLQEVVSIEARAVVVSTPSFTHRHLFDGSPLQAALKSRTVSHPWMVANLLLREPPDGPGRGLAWDNVVYGSPSLGYVNANHQILATTQSETVLTYYLPLPSNDPDAMRRKCQGTGWQEWSNYIITDLYRPHPQLLKYLMQLDVWLWGHGMAAALPGYIWEASTSGGRPRSPSLGIPGIFRAHSDMSGISIFEEAQYHGVNAASHALEFLARRA